MRVAGAMRISYMSGDVVMWRKFAATLKLRMGMRLADMDPALAQTYLSEALAAGCLESGETDATSLAWYSSPGEYHLQCFYCGQQE